MRLYRWKIGIGIFAGLAGLSACVPFGSPKPVQSLSLFEEAISVQAPAGYCIDPEVSEPAIGFLVLAGCGSVIDDIARQNPPGIATYQIGEAGSAIVADQEADLVSYLKTAAGRSLLGATPDDIWSQDGVVGLHFRDGGDFRVSGMQDGEWRLFVDAGDRLVTLRLRSSLLNPVPTDRGFEILRKMAAGIHG